MVEHAIQLSKYFLLVSFTKKIYFFSLFIPYFLERMLIGGQLILGFYGIDSAKIKVDGLCEVAIKKLKKNENDLGNFIDSVYFWLYNDFSKWRCSQFCMKDVCEIIRYFTFPFLTYLGS